MVPNRPEEVRAQQGMLLTDWSPVAGKERDPSAVSIRHLPFGTGFQP